MMYPMRHIAAVPVLALAALASLASAGAAPRSATAGSATSCWSGPRPAKDGNNIIGSSENTNAASRSNQDGRTEHETGKQNQQKGHARNGRVDFGGGPGGGR